MFEHFTTNRVIDCSNTWDFILSWLKSTKQIDFNISLLRIIIHLHNNIITIHSYSSIEAISDWKLKMQSNPKTNVVGYDITESGNP